LKIASKNIFANKLRGALPMRDSPKDGGVVPIRCRLPAQAGLADAIAFLHTELNST